jgi:outer membrane receptor protein involved in Fe transport
MDVKRVSIFVCSLVLIFLFTQAVFSGTTGKISGSITDKETGEPLPGANITIPGTLIGAAADVNGNYVILHVPPGIYDIEASMMGYTKVLMSNIRVMIDQTAKADFALGAEAITGEEVTIVAEKNIIKEDVATSVVAVSENEVATLPLTSVEEVVELQAGVENGLVIRGGSADEALYLMDGITLRDPRNNRPITGLSLSAIKEISIERGGFNAEYGQIRSGLINVITKEGDKNNYWGSISLKASPPAPKNFGLSPFDKNSMWMKPYLDDAVCWTGTEVGEPYEDVNGNGTWDAGEPFEDLNGNGIRSYWDIYDQRQYPIFRGWNTVSEELLQDSDPTNDLTPEAAQRLFDWEHRKRPITDQPDYNIDGGFGGPVPFIGNKLGNLRFFTSYRREREMLLVPLTRDDYLEHNWTLKLTSDLSKSMKLTLSGLTGKFYTVAINEGDEIYLTNKFGPNDNRATNYWYPTIYLRTPLDIAKVTAEQRAGRIFSNSWYSGAEVEHYSFAAKLTHTLNPSTYYEASIEHIARDYLTGPVAARDTTRRYEIVPGYFVDEAPYGWSPLSTGGIGGAIKFFGGHTGEARDSSRISATTFKVDLTSQLNFSNLAKVGFEFVYNDLKLHYGDVNTFTSRIVMVNEHQFPYRGAFYLQDKLETLGFILNAGLRLDFSNANGRWLKPASIYDRSFFSSDYDPNGKYPSEDIKTDLSLSPRLGISHPITENSKLFFNYGHFKQLPTYEELLRVGRAAGGALKNYGDPNMALAKTISYELGFDQVLFNSLLVQAAAFYHDITDQLSYTTYASADGSVIYSAANNDSYEDIRGFELSLNKSSGWLSGFANYTYQVNTYGYFGKRNIYENLSEQRQYDENTRLLYQGKPLPQPYARVSLMLHSPKDFGPGLMGINPLEDCTLDILYFWRAGEYIDWNPYNRLGVYDNVQVRDYHNMAMRLNKTFSISKMNITLFMEVENLLNTKRLSGAGFYDGFDYQYYMESLHLPASKDYDNIVGNDKPGDYRKNDAPFQPIEQVGNVADLANPSLRAIYYEKNSGKYMSYTEENGWAEVNKSKIQKILDDKAYIDMPNQSSFSFLNPRQWFFGIKVSTNL